MEGEGAAPSTKRTPLGTGVWYRYRHLVYALFAANVAMVSYAVLNQDKFFKKPVDSRDSKEDAKPKTEESKPKMEEIKPKTEEIKFASPVVKQQVSRKEQIEIYKWILEEKRKIKPANSKEKASIDVEKGILKDYIRGKISL